MKKFLIAALAASACAMSAVADGVICPFDVAGIASHDGQGAAGNVTVDVDVAACLGLPSGTPVVMNGIGWDVTLFADPAVGPFGGSWLNELVVGFGADDPDPNSSVIFLSPGAGSTFPGTGTFTSPVLKFFPLGLPDIALPNGVLQMHFFESFDDAIGVTDGRWLGGALLIQAIPEPASLGLLALGGLLAFRRR